MPVHSESVIPLPVRIEAGDEMLDGDLSLPADAAGLVVFAHGSGSSRHSARSGVVAEALQRAQLGTLMLDLLTEPEARVDVITAEFRFDIPRLAKRVVAAIDWAAATRSTSSLAIGLFGASTGAAATLIAAAERPATVRAVVSRGGRPDLAEEALERVVAPTLLIVGGRDEVVVQLNRQAYGRLRPEKHLDIVAGATHLFEEPGALDEVSRVAREWFLRYLA
jgi:putative phosphoribosyl transferase